MYRIPEYVTNPRKHQDLGDDSDEDFFDDVIQEEEELEEDHINPKGIVHEPSKCRPWTEGELENLKKAWESIDENAQRKRKS